MNCGIGRRHSLDPVLLWLWCRLVAAAPIRPLAWELPHAVGAALKRQKKKEKELLVYTMELWNLMVNVITESMEFPLWLSS